MKLLKLPLPNSFTKNLVFGLGVQAGFFSEINNMIIAIVYCLHNNIGFKLHSSNANFKFEKGWQDYFDPFCHEITNTLLDKYNKRYRLHYQTDYAKPRRMYRKIRYELYLWYTKKYSRTNFLTFDLWENILDRNLETIHYKIPEYNIDGDLQHACNRISNLIWNFNSDTAVKIRSTIDMLNLPHEYIGFQIRRGDKFTENDFVPIDRYIEEAERISNLRNGFIFTDDYLVIKDLKERHTSWNFFTLCFEYENGYEHGNFYNQDKQEVYNGIIRLLTNIEILRSSNFFLGTFSANPSMFLGMIMEREKVKSLDVPWQIWYGKNSK